jgi:hypothetical protein
VLVRGDIVVHFPSEEIFRLDTLYLLTQYIEARRWLQRTSASSGLRLESQSLPLGSFTGLREFLAGPEMFRGFQHFGDSTISRSFSLLSHGHGKMRQCKQEAGPTEEDSSEGQKIDDGR